PFALHDALPIWERDRHLRTFPFVPGDEFEEEFLETPDLPAHVPDLGPEGPRGLEDLGLDPRSPSHVDAGRARFRLKARLPEPLGKGLVVAADVDPESVRGTGQEIV